ncbi:cystathionine beta-lyase [Teredinibacter turnerae]|uniref:cystathionine beta-lyase n=1 Tax=Teredinibacter turnerae TaxID=2426 RepID=UPI0003A35129|nr:cystathionine beta-lyase [Teredinibacter turnerae]
MTRKKRIDTSLVHLCDPMEQRGFVNPPVYLGSTVIYRDVDELETMNQDPLRRKDPRYGRFGTPSSHTFESALAQLEGGVGTVTTNCGLSAITTSLLAFVKAGDHILVADSVYLPTKIFCLEVLADLGVYVEFYPPEIGGHIDRLIRQNTRLIFLESPGSGIYEIQDVPAICEVAKRFGVITILDNTWGTPLFFKAISHGVNVSVHAATKYIVGHADSMLGAIVCKEEQDFASVRKAAIRLGQNGSPNDIYLATRGLRTLSVRLQHHQKQATKLAQWLEQQSSVERVYYPALPEHPGYEIFIRDFKGACGLLTVVFRPCDKALMNSMINSLELFGLGHSWGGFESLVVPFDPLYKRQYLNWPHKGQALRIHVGLEDINDLIADLEHGFKYIAKP